eukprot:756347-Pelagomonas_calceolata.AAC.1
MQDLFPGEGVTKGKGHYTLLPTLTRGNLAAFMETGAKVNTGWFYPPMPIIKHLRLRCKLFPPARVQYILGVYQRPQSATAANPRTSPSWPACILECAKEGEGAAKLQEGMLQGLIMAGIACAQHGISIIEVQPSCLAGTRGQSSSPSPSATQVIEETRAVYMGMQHMLDKETISVTPAELHTLWLPRVVIPAIVSPASACAQTNASAPVPSSIETHWCLSIPFPERACALPATH